MPLTDYVFYESESAIDAKKIELEGAFYHGTGVLLLDKNTVSLTIQCDHGYHTVLPWLPYSLTMVTIQSYNSYHAVLPWLPYSVTMVTHIFRPKPTAQ